MTTEPQNEDYKDFSNKLTKEITRIREELGIRNIYIAFMDHGNTTGFFHLLCSQNVEDIQFSMGVMEATEAFKDKLQAEPIIEGTGLFNNATKEVKINFTNDPEAN